MPAASMKQLLESGVHFGHQTRRWNPKMKPFIFTERGGIHIIDLQQTTVLLDRAYDFVRNIAGRGGTVLFVGTKKQCQDVVREEAARVGMPYVSHRWLGGLLTNFATIDNRIKRMHELRKLKEEGQLSLLPTKERMGMERELEKLEINLGGVGIMTRLPDAVFVADPKREAIATKEVNKLGIPLIGLCDTNCDPDEVEYLIPGNDDAIRSCSLIVKTLARAVEEGRQKLQVADFQKEEAAVSAHQGEYTAYSSGEGPVDDTAGGRAGRGPRGSSGPGTARGQRRTTSGGSGTAGGRSGYASRAGEGSRYGSRSEAAGSTVTAARRAPVRRAAAVQTKEQTEQAPAAPDAAGSDAPVAEATAGGAEAPVEAVVAAAEQSAGAAEAGGEAAAADTETAEAEDKS